MRTLLTILLVPFAVAYIVLVVVMAAPFLVYAMVADAVFGNPGPEKKITAILDRMLFV